MNTGPIVTAQYMRSFVVPEILEFKVADRLLGVTSPSALSKYTSPADSVGLRPRTPEKAYNTTAVPNQVIQAVTLLLLMCLPLLQRSQQSCALHDNIEMKAKKHSHPGLCQLIILAGHETRRERMDEMQELVVLVITGSNRQRPQLKIRARWR